MRPVDGCFAPHWGLSLDWVGCYALALRGELRRVEVFGQAVLLVYWEEFPAQAGAVCRCVATG